MDFPSESKTPIKRRRHSPEFKERVVEETLQPGASIAAVAQRHGVNANLVHKWRRSAQHGTLASSTPAFIPLSGTSTVAQPPLPEVRIELASAQGFAMTLFWPCDQPRSLAEFLKPLS